MLWRNLYKTLRRSQARKKYSGKCVQRNRRSLVESLESRALMAADVAEAYVEEGMPVEVAVDFEALQPMAMSLFSAETSDRIEWLQESKIDTTETSLDLHNSFAVADVLTVAYDGPFAPEIYYSLPVSTLSDRADSADNVSDVFQWEWHNSIFPTDVDGDSSVTPNDAMLVINVLNEFGRAAIFSLEETSMSSMTIDDQKYFDVNQDDEITPSDVLIIIEYLNDNLQSPTDNLASISVEDANNSLFAPELGRMAQVITDDSQVLLDDGIESFDDVASSDLFETRLADPDWIAATFVADDGHLAKIAAGDSEAIDLALSDDELFENV